MHFSFTSKTNLSFLKIWDTPLYTIKGIRNNNVEAIFKNGKVKEVVVSIYKTKIKESKY